MASNGGSTTLESQTDQPTTVDKRVRQLIDKCKGKAVWYMRLQLLTDEDVKAIAKELEVDEACEELYLNNNQITATGIGHVAELLKNNRKLKILNLRDNAIGDEGIQCLCEVLTLHNTLVGLNLSNTGMTYKSGSAVAKMIEKAETLVQLDLRQEERLPPLTVRRIMQANRTGKIENLLYERLSDENESGTQE